MKKFAKGEQLLAADLNALAGGLEELQAAPRGKAGSMRGHVTYGHAWYNVTGTDGTALNAPGVLAGVCYVSGIDEPCIEDGVMKLLPPSGGGSGECSCVLAQYNISGIDDTPGKIASVRFAAISMPQISDGGMQLPLAHATVAADGTVATGVAGALAGVEVVDPAKPWIGSGTLKLPLAGAISGVEYAGLVKKVEYVSGIDEPEIDCGVLRLPVPEPLVLELYTASVPDDGTDGWIMSAYMPMIMASDGSGDLLVSFRQLMRVYEGKLQVNFQRAIAPTGAWENYG